MITITVESKSTIDRFEGMDDKNRQPTKTNYLGVVIRNNDKIVSGAANIQFIVSDEEFDSFTVGQRLQVK